MKLSKKIILTILFVFSIFIFLNTNSYAGYQSWNSLDFDVEVTDDGDMKVVETWDIYISETNTVFKSFEVDRTKFSRIEDVRVVEIKDGEEVYLEDCNQYQYHVDPGCFYALNTNSNTFEIAWNVGFDNSSGDRVYKIYYTVTDAVTVYKDCTELYWQFLSKENTMTGNNITGRIKLPNSVSNEELLRVWAHGPLTGEIRKAATNGAIFEIPSIGSNQMLEVRLVTEENIYNENAKKYNTLKLDSILEEEQIWANEANEKRENAKKIMFVIICIAIGLVLVNIFIAIIFIKKAKIYKAVGSELKERYPRANFDNIEYFRDIPDEENATPARAAFMYNFKNNNSSISSALSKIFSATILSLSLKGLIAFEAIDEKEVRIIRTKLDLKKEDELTEDENKIYSMIKDAMLGKDYITPKEFSKYASDNYESVYTKLNSLDKIIERDLLKLKKISEEKKQISDKWSGKFGLNILGFILSMVIVWILPVMPIGFIILAIFANKNAKAITILNRNGEEEKVQWKALKKYMEDYSLLKEKLVPDIVLWEKYLVYATAFGISKKVIEQLKVVHPEMFVGNNQINNSTYWYMVSDSRFGDNMFDNFSKSMEKVYSSASSAYNIAHSSSSSGSGGGGGFSSGGGGRRRRWKLRWPLIFVKCKFFVKMGNKIKFFLDFLLII